MRGRGLLLGLDLVKDRRTRTPDPELAQRVARECLELGMMTSVVRGGFGIFRIAPPLTIERPIELEIFDRAPGLRRSFRRGLRAPRTVMDLKRDP